MLTKQEIEIMRNNAKVHNLIFEKIKKIIKPWLNIKDIDDLCWKLAKKQNVLCGFKWV